MGTTFADSQRSLLLPRTRTIAQMGSPTGRQVGPRRRRSGAAHTTARAALVRAMAARLSAPPPLLTTATRASPTGSLAGAPRRSSGAARTQERAAHSRVEAAPEGTITVPLRAEGIGPGAGACAPSSGADSLCPVRW